MRRFAWIAVVILSLVVSTVGVAWRQGWVRLPGLDPHEELAAQLRDRGPIAVVGGAPLGLTSQDTTLQSAGEHPALEAALSGRDGSRVAQALRGARLDGLMVRTDRSLGAPGTVRSSLSAMRSVRGLGATYLDETAALYEPIARPEVSPEDARRMVSVARLVLSGAVAPPERIFPEPLRRPQPVEVALILRDGHEPIIWRAARGGSIARALLDVTFAVVDRWSTRQQDRYGRLREALQTRTLTVAVFYDKGVLGARGAAFLRRAADPSVFAVGYERLANWEYALPPTPWAPAPDPSVALFELARDRGVPRPGYLRPEITLYRFRALQLIEQSPGGAVQLFDPG